MNNHLTDFIINMFCIVTILIASYISLFSEGGYLNDESIDVVCGHEVSHSECEEFRKEINSQPKY